MMDSSGIMRRLRSTDLSEIVSGVEDWDKNGDIDGDDGLPDGWIDFDNDGEYDLGEFENENCDGDHDDTGSYGSGSIANDPRETRPLKWDTDGDGLPDGLEIGLTEKDVTDHTDLNKGNFWSDADAGETMTDPTDTDTDDDGIPDGWMDKNNDDLQTMVEGEDLNLDGAIEGDTNLNGNWDQDEEWTETNPSSTLYSGVSSVWVKYEFLSTYGTDTDGDGLPDGLELGLHSTQAAEEDTDPLDQNDFIHQFDAPGDTATTDPLCIDSDGDGLPDGWIDGWGYSMEKNEWWLAGTGNTVPNRCEGEDFNRNGKYNGGNAFFTNIAAGIIDPNNGETIPDTVTDLNEDDIPDGTDTDGDGLQDGLEQVGWYVEVFYERNPNLRKPKVLRWSDPLMEDTDGDGLDDTDESLYGGDPWIDDTDGDGIADADENDAGSAVDGIEASAPQLDGGLDLSRGYDTHWKKKWGIPIGVRIEVEITVGGIVTDNVGVKYVYVEVSTIGAHDDVYLRPGSEDDVKRYEFEHTFEFDLSLKKLVGDFFAGWDIYVNVSDINDNYADKKDHLSSVIGAFLDAIKDAIKAFIDMIWEWLKEKFIKMVEKVVKAILSPIMKLMESFADSMVALYNSLSEESNNRAFTESDLSTILKYILMFSIPIMLVAGLYIAIDQVGTGATGGAWPIGGKLIGIAIEVTVSRLLMAGAVCLVGGTALGAIVTLATNPSSSSDWASGMAEFGSAFTEFLAGITEFIVTLWCGLEGLTWVTLSLVFSMAALILCLFSNLIWEEPCLGGADK